MKKRPFDFQHVPALNQKDEFIYFQETINPKIIDCNTDIMRIEDDLEVKGEVMGTSDGVLIRAEINGVKHFICSRCLDNISEEFTKTVNIVYDTALKKVFDALPEIREEIQLDSPIKFLCKDNCAGLCSKCGVNLNKTKCHCKSVTKVV